MVGVAGRSKGCKTCKTRRVKCDESKPDCARCIKAGYSCAGYRRELDVRIATPNEAGRLSVPIPASDKRRVSRKHGTIHGGEYHIHLVALPRTQQRSPKTSSQAHGNDLAAHEPCVLVMPPTMSLVAFKDAMSLALLLDHSVWSSFGYPWLQESATGHLGSLAKDACAALSRCAFGRRHGQRHIELEGAVSYGRVLREVRSQLATSKSIDALLVPMLLLSYTANSQQSQHEFDIHLGGMVALLQATGPEPYQDPRLAKAFSSCRCMLILTGIISRKRTFLEEVEWLHKSWTSDEVSNGQDRLVDILAAIPGILEDMTPLEVQLSKRAGLRQSLQRRIQHSLGELQAWRRRWATTFPNPTKDVPRTKPPTFTRRELPPEAKSLLVYESFERSAEFSLHSAILICLLSLSKSIVVPDLTSWEVREARWHEMLISDNRNPLPDVPMIARGLGLRAVAIQIVRTFEYQLQHIQHHQERALFWLFPLGLAGLILIEEPLWMSTIEDLRRASQGDRGYGEGPDTVVPEAAVSAVCWSRNPDLTSNEAVGSAHCFWYAAQGGWKKAERIWSIHP